ncbi:hypothetical protein SAMN05444166_2774 [Singulisphaera sp. GP187]|nr:hypothetical protein SAMN05444166_2774 [Singulisphaera sp. GP187]
MMSLDAFLGALEPWGGLGWRVATRGSLRPKEFAGHVLLINFSRRVGLALEEPLLVDPAVA